MKKCNGKCQQVKALSQFHIKRSAFDGRATICAKCSNEAQSKREKRKPVNSDLGELDYADRKEFVNWNDTAQYCG